MQRNIRRASPRFAVKALSALIAAAAFGSASAAGLGKLNVLSALGQPLRAEIELTSVSREEADTLVARLASSQAFKQANVDFSPALTTLRFAVEQRGARQIIRISSSQPVNEPYVGMLIELVSSKGRLVREYTFLLDPPELRQTQTASIAAPIIASKLPDVAQGAPASEKHPISEQSSSPRKAQKVAKKSTDADVKAAEGKGEYQVRRGDTLGSIAVRHKSQGVSLDQTLVSIYRANPDAFIDNNMNRLKSGRVIAIPDAATAGDISQSEARKIIIAQSSDFDQYRNKLADTVAQAPSQQVEQTAQVASGKITTKVDEQPSPASKSADRLKLAKENAGAAAPDKAAGVVSTEDKLSQDKSVADAQARIRELEKNIKELQGILELRSKELTVQQKQADTATAAKQSDPATAAKPADAAAPVAQAPAPAPAAAPLPTPEAKPKPKPVTPPPPPPQPSFLDDLLGNTTMLGAIAAAILGVGYLLWSSIRRKKKAQEITDKFLAEPNTETSPNSLFGTTGGQSINTNNSIFNSSFTPSASQLDANEVDPVAEADVYIAYGREAQAIEILKDALRMHPDRNAVRIKLLEIYASQGDVFSFDALASDLYALTKGEGEDWAYIAKMGASIDPKNPLYTDGDLLEEMADRPTSLHALTNPIEALDPDSLTAPSRLDMEIVTPGPAVQPVGLAAVEPVVDDPETALWADLPLDISGFDAQPAAEARSLPEEPKLEDLTGQASFAAGKPDMLQDLPFEQIEIRPPAVPESAKNENELEFESMIEFELSPDKSSVAIEEERESIDLTAMPVVEEIVVEPLLSDSDEEPVFGEQEQAVTQAPAQKREVMEESGAFPYVPQAEMPTLNTPFLDLLNESPPVVAAEPVSEAAPLEFDFSSINLDLETSAVDLSGYKPGSFGKEVPLINIEMATKLDLAVAYMEIGDKEGARELLEEVIKGGTDEQVAKAKETLAKLG